MVQTAYDIEIFVQDSMGGEDSTTLHVEVTETNEKPVFNTLLILADLPKEIIEIEESLNLNISATDSDHRYSESHCRQAVL